VQKVDELLRDVPMFAGMAADRLELIAGCASNRIFRPGDYLLHEGERADSFFVIRRGDVAVETYVPQRGALTLETLHDGDVLGWSWLFPPYRLAFDARAAATVHSVAFDGRCLRGKCEEDHDLGYDLMIRFAGVMVERLQAARMQLLDVYGHVAR
jgi:CRP-like cAMP-binding protein